MNFMKNETAQKLRGGYYTPTDLAEFLVRWIREIGPRTILEPSCGDGNFFAAISTVGGFDKTQIQGVELDSSEAVRARKRAEELRLKNCKVQTGDFLEWALGKLSKNDEGFDAVLGNPPFVRYQYLPKLFQETAERVFAKFDLKFTKHTNAWVPFIVASVALLRPGGRLAMVVPAELIHVTHAQSLRAYLVRECRRITIIDPEELWFEDTLQGAVLLMAEKKTSSAEAGEGVSINPVRSREFLNQNPSSVFSAHQAVSGAAVAGKWTRALLDDETRTLLESLVENPGVHRFDDIAEVDVGIVTGANKFFLVSDEVVREYKLQRWAHPMFGRSEHCPGVVYDEHQHRTNAENGNPTNFLWFKDDQVERDKFAKSYIEQGKQLELHTRYKCRIRSPWYSVPSVYSTEIGMLKRSHDTPRLILNALSAYTTDTAYRISSSKVKAEKLVSCFVNPLTALSAEVEGRHYGGGVLELVPSEIERLLVPVPTGPVAKLKALDSDVRKLPTQDVLAKQADVVLSGIGLSKDQKDCLLQGWKKLRDRRHRNSSEADSEEL